MTSTTGIPSLPPRAHRLLDAEPDGGDVLLGDRPADDGVDELEPLAARAAVTRAG